MCAVITLIINMCTFFVFSSEFIDAATKALSYEISYNLQ